MLLPQLPLPPSLKKLFWFWLFMVAMLRGRQEKAKDGLGLSAWPQISWQTVEVVGLEECVLPPGVCKTI